LTAQSYLFVALAAIHWLALSRLEGYFTFLTALSAYCFVHLAIRVTCPVTVKTATLSLSCLTTRWAALGLISIPFGSVELLLHSSEGESSAAVRTL